MKNKTPPRYQALQLISWGFFFSPLPCRDLCFFLGSCSLKVNTLPGPHANRDTNTFARPGDDNTSVYRKGVLDNRNPQYFTGV